MATDWSGRTAALKYYEHELAIAKRSNFVDREFIEEAVNALRRSQDHTAIQTKLNDTLKVIRRIRDMTDVDNPESYRRDDREGCLDTVFAMASEALKSPEGKKGDDRG